jgi:hypothetical protein
VLFAGVWEAAMNGRKLTNSVLNGLPQAMPEKEKPSLPARSRFGDSYNPAFSIVDEQMQAGSEPAPLEAAAGLSDSVVMPHDSCAQMPDFPVLFDF